MLRIPIDTKGGAAVRQRVNLDGLTLAMRIYWNERDAHWFADFETVNGKRYGVRLVPRAELLGINREILGGCGLVILQDDDSDTAGLGYDNLGTSYGMYYIDGDDTAELREAGVI